MNFVYRIAVVVVGLTVLLVGLLLPYPGIGWATLPLGLVILATESTTAQKPLTVTLVVAALWLFGVVGWGAARVGVDWPWLTSPLHCILDR